MLSIIIANKVRTTLISVHHRCHIPCAVFAHTASYITFRSSDIKIWIITILLSLLVSVETEGENSLDGRFVDSTKSHCCFCILYSCTVCVHFRAYKDNFSFAIHIKKMPKALRLESSLYDEHSTRLCGAWLPIPLRMHERISLRKIIEISPTWP